MANSDDPKFNPLPALDCVEFFDLQRLLAADLQALRDRSDALHTLHNRTFHGWGVGAGFEVSGAAGDKQVKVGPGYAVDAFGNDIISDGEIVLTVPQSAGLSSGGKLTPQSYFLVVQHAGDAELRSVQRGSAKCSPCSTPGTVRLLEAPIIAWRDQTPKFGVEIILAEVSILNCKLNTDVSTAARRDARAPRQPYIAAGGTPVGNTAWKYFPDGVPLTDVAGVQTVVDTSAATFALTPRYFARLDGPRMWSGGSTPEYLDGFVHIADASANRFTFQVYMPRGFIAGTILLNPTSLFTPDLPQKLTAPMNWSVVWMGLEGLV